MIEELKNQLENKPLWLNHTTSDINNINELSRKYKKEFSEYCIQKYFKLKNGAYIYNGLFFINDIVNKKQKEAIAIRILNKSLKNVDSFSFNLVFPALENNFFNKAQLKRIFNYALKRNIDGKDKILSTIISIHPKFSNNIKLNKTSLMDSGIILNVMNNNPEQTFMGLYHDEIESEARIGLVPPEFQDMRYITDNVREISYYLFGYETSRVQKIYRSCLLERDTINWNKLLNIHLLFNYYNYDKVCNYVENESDDVISYIKFEEFQLLLDALSEFYNEDRILKLIFDDNIGDIVFWGLRDLAEMLEHMSIDDLPKKPKNLSELHDIVSVAYEELLAGWKRERGLNQSELYCLDKIKIDDLHIFVPKKAVDLIIAGRQLRHCVASYTDSVVQKRRYIICLVNKDRRHVYTVELSRDFYIEEARGFANKDMPEEIKDKLEKIIETNFKDK